MKIWVKLRVPRKLHCCTSIRLFLLMFQTIFRLSDTAVNCLFAFFQCFSVYFLAFFLPFRSCLWRIFQQGYQLCCTGCHSIYPWKECVITHLDGKVESKRCSFRAFPDHPQEVRRRPCGQVLMKTVKNCKGKPSLYPKLLYCYKSVIEALRDILVKPGFVDKCELWRTRNTVSNVYFSSSERMCIPIMAVGEAASSY